MTTENQETQADNKQQPPIPFGSRLRAARETAGLTCKDVASQLRLSEKIILMMEKDRYPVDLPVTFIRGYLRAYGRILKIPEYEIKKAIEPIKAKASQNYAPLLAATPAVTSGNYFMQFFTFFILMTIVGLVGTWWYSHPQQSSTIREQSVSSINPQQNAVTLVPPPTQMAQTKIENPAPTRPDAESLPPSVQQSPSQAKSTPEKDDVDFDNF